MVPSTGQVVWQEKGKREDERDRVRGVFPEETEAQFGR